MQEDRRTGGRLPTAAETQGGLVCSPGGTGLEGVEVGRGVRRSGQLSRQEAMAWAGRAEGGGHTSSMAGGPPLGCLGQSRCP